MAMTVKRKKETSVKKVIQHRIADRRGGVTVKTADLGGDYLFEGTPLGAPVNGLCSVVKLATLVTLAAADATTYEVAKGQHFKVGDFVANEVGGTSVTITAIDKSNSAKDVITLSATLGVELPVGSVLLQAAAAGASAELMVKPESINGTNYEIKSNDNIFTDAWLIAVTKDNLPSAILSEMKGIIQI